MKNIFTMVCAMLIISTKAQNNSVNVGIGTNVPEATLDISRINPADLPVGSPQGILLPKFTSAERATFENVEKGTLIFNTTKDCVEMYSGNVKEPWGSGTYADVFYWKCLTSAKVKIKVEGVGFEGTYLAGLSMDTDNKVKFKITNNTSSPIAGLDLSTALDIHNGTGSTVQAKIGQNTSVTVPANGNVIVEYELEGTPTGGALFVAFSYPSLYADQTQPVGRLVVTAEGFEGTYIKNWVMTSDNKVKFKVHNSSTKTINNLNFVNAPYLSNTGGVSISAQNNSSYNAVSIPAGGSYTLTYNVSGTPNSGALKAVFNNSLTTTADQTINVGTLDVSQDGYLGSYMAGVTITSGNNKVKFALKNNSTTPITNVDFSNAITSIENAAGGTVSVVGGQNTSVSIPPGGTVTLSYNLVGMPTGQELKTDFDYLGSQASQIITVQNITSTAIGFEGYYFKNMAMTAGNKVNFTIYNSTSSAFNNMDLSNVLTLSGTGLGTLQIQPGQHTNVSLAPGTSKTLSYTLVSGGIPADGNIEASFNYFESKAFQGIGVSKVTPVGFDGNYVTGIAMANTNWAKFNIQNTGTHSTNVMNLFSAASIQNPAGGSVAIQPGQHTSVIVSGGTTSNIYFRLIGMPVAGNLVATLLNASQTKEVMRGQASIPSKAEVIAYSLLFDGAVNYQGVFDNNKHKMKVRIPYTNGMGSYNTTSSTVSVTGQAGDNNNLTLTIPAGNFNSSGEIEGAISVDGDGVFNVTALQAGHTANIATFPITLNGISFNVTIQAYGGIPDRKYYEKTNGKYEHKFVYMPMKAPDGRIWLTNNLGADYANIGPDNNYANVMRVANNLKDYKAYGSRFQWQRPADGYELMNWTSSTSGTPVYGTTTNLASSWTPNYSQFILNNGPVAANNQSWLNDTTLYGGPHNLWQGSNGAHNPCPEGYHVPSQAERPVNSYDIETNNPLHLTGAFLERENASIEVLSIGSGRVYPYAGFWTSELNTIGSRRDFAWIGVYYDPYKYFASTGSTLFFIHNKALSQGLPVRCIKD